MKKIYLFLASCIFSQVLLAQYNTSHNSSLGFMVSYYYVSGPASEKDPHYFKQGTYSGRSVTPSFHFQMSRVKGLGYYIDGSLGGQMAKVRLDGTNTPGFEGFWGEDDFMLYADLRLGIQYTYNNSEKEWFVGGRYFYWANAGGTRYLYGNADELAGIGFYGAYKHLGVDLNIGLRSTPGVLINSNWNIYQLELKYCLKKFDSGKSTWLAGVRLERCATQATTRSSGIMAFTAIGL